LAQSARTAPDAALLPRLALEIEPSLETGAQVPRFVNRMIGGYGRFARSRLTRRRPIANR